MKRLMSIGLTVLLALSMTGCLSSMVYRDSEQKVALRKAVLSNNERAIQAIRLGDNGVGVGINVLALEAIKEQPIKQLGAAIGDALIIWGAYEGVTWAADEINGDNNESTKQDSGRDSNQITVTGDGNDVHVGDESTTTAPAE